jgi:hypothetical protein
MANETDNNIDRIGRLGTAAWKRLKTEKNWNDYMALGECFVTGRAWSFDDSGTNDINDPRFKKSFSGWLNKYHVDDFDRSDRVKLMYVMEHRAEIEGWRSTLTMTERLKLNHPTSVLRKWQKANEVRPLGKRRTSDKPTVATLKRELAAKDVYIKELEAARGDLAPLMAADPDSKAVRCSFCGKSSKRTHITLVAAPDATAHICDGCVDTCIEVIGESKKAKKAKKAAS